MLRRPLRQSQRRAAALVETAVVACIFLMILFGILEFTRYLFMKQLIENAAREGARYAVVHTYDTTVETDTKNAVLYRMNGYDTKVKNFTILLYRGDSSGNRATSYNSTATTNFAYFSDGGGTYMLDSTSTKIYTSKDATGTYVLDSSSSKVYLNLDSKTATVSGVNPATFSAYTSSKKIQSVEPISDAKFGEYVVVEITCDYDPITPTLLRANQTIQIKTKAMMYSEAN